MTKNNHNNYLLAGDIGGTKTALALYEDNPLLPLEEITVQNDSVSGLDEIIASFLRENNARPKAACFGVAGPVINNKVTLTNRDWVLDGHQLQTAHGLQSVFLINDLVATAMGAIHLPEDKLHTLNKGKRDVQAPIAVLAPGTGLGEAFMVSNNNTYLPFPSEGGHSLFSPSDARQIRLLSFLQQKKEPVTTEHVCSGLGIPSLYDFLKTEMPEPRDLAARIAEADDQTKIIVEEALNNISKSSSEKDNLCVETLRLFTDILATEAANLILKVLGTGGLFIGGGIPPRILPFLTRETFMRSFARGVYKKMLNNISVHIILEPKTALIGAAAYGFSMGNR